MKTEMISSPEGASVQQNVDQNRPLSRADLLLQAVLDTEAHHGPLPPSFSGQVNHLRTLGPRADGQVGYIYDITVSTPDGPVCKAGIAPLEDRNSQHR